MIRALIAKDVTLFFRNRFFALVSGLGLVAYIAIYFLMPPMMENTLTIGIYPPEIPEVFIEEAGDEGLVFVPKTSEEALRAGMTGRDQEYNVAFVLPEGFAATLASGQPLDEDVTILFTADFPEELKDAYTLVIEEFAYLISGQTLNINAQEEIIGQDLTGSPLAARDRLIPLLALLVLMVEALGLASLISSEVEGRTLEALLTTPVKVTDIFLSKGITGVLLAFGQAVLVVGVIGGLARQPLLVLVVLLLGALLVTGIAFLIASSARDLLGVMAWAVPLMIVLAIPAFGVIFPGTTTIWGRAIPTYYLVDALHRIVNFGAGPAEVWASLLVLLAFSAVFVALGIAALRRKFR